MTPPATNTRPTSAGLISGSVWARKLGVIIAFDLFVIWALTAHGRDIVGTNEC